MLLLGSVQFDEKGVIRTKKGSSTVQKSAVSCLGHMSRHHVWSQMLRAFSILYLWTIITLEKYEENIELKHVNRLRKYSSR